MSNPGWISFIPDALALAFLLAGYFLAGMDFERQRERRRQQRRDMSDEC